MGAAEDHANLMDIAKRAFGDAVDDIDAFVTDGMTKLGHKRRTEWDDAEPTGGQQPPARSGLGFGGSGSGAPSGGQTRRVGSPPPAGRTGDYQG